jgi:hypothetical protein
MKKILPAAVLAALVLAWAGCETTAMTQSPQGHVVVNYDHPEKFTDLKSSADGGTEPGYLDSLRNFLVTEAGKYLQPDQTLTMTFTDIDMAGEIGMNVRNSDVRVLKPSYPLRLNFSYTLSDASGKVLKEGKEELVEAFPNVQMGPDRGDPLFHEKTKLADWLRKTLK